MFAYVFCKALRNLPESSDLSQPWKELYWEFVVGSTLDPLVVWLGWLLREICSQWNRVPGLSFLNNEFSLTWRIAQNTLPPNEWAFKVGLADIPDWPHCGSSLEETALHAFYYCKWVHMFWSHVGESTVCISPKQLVLLNIGYIMDNVDLPYWGEKHLVFLAIFAVARMVIWETGKKGLYDDINFSHRDLILFFRHRLRVKIRCDRKHLDHIAFNKRWVHAENLVVRRGAMLE